MKVVITGAGGFIGKSVTSYLLEQGHSIVALVRDAKDITFPHPNLIWHVGDITDASFVNSLLTGAEYIVHLAARKQDEPTSYVTNVLGTKNILMAAETAGLRGIINISTISTKFTNRGVYGNTKKEADELVAHSKIPSTTLRLSVVYGDMHSGIFGTLLRYTRLPIVPVIGSGTPTYRPMHVGDVAIAINKILQSPSIPKRAYDIGGPDLISFNDLARLLASTVYGKKVTLLHIPITLAYAIAKVFSLFFKNPPITASNVTGAIQHAEVEPDAFNTEYDFRPLTLAQGLQKMIEAGHVHATEPYVLLRYVLPGSEPGPYQANLFKQMTTKYGLDQTQSKWLLASNARIGALDAVTRLTQPDCQFQKKLLAAASIMECSPLSNSLLPQERSMPALLFRLSADATLSTCKLLYGLVLICIPGVYKHNA